MLEARAETESLIATLVPRFLVTRFGVKYEATADGAKWGGTKVKQAIEIFPCQDPWDEGSLIHDIES